VEEPDVEVEEGGEEVDEELELEEEEPEVVVGGAKNKGAEALATVRLVPLRGQEVTNREKRAAHRKKRMVLLIGYDCLFKPTLFVSFFLYFV
jgi:hypothetical protein